MPKMTLAFLGLTFSALLISGYIALTGIKDVGRYALESSSYLSHSATTDSTNALEALGEKIIGQKARDVAVQCEIFIKSHPDMTIFDLQKDPDFRKIAIQPIGKTGYTILYEKHTGIMRMHPNPQLVNFDVHKLQSTLPSFWGIFEPTLDGSHHSGYYNWEEPDGSIRQKFMYMVPVKDLHYMIAATTYIDEFSKPALEIEKKIAVSNAKTGQHINKRIESTLNSFVVLFIILMLIVTLTSYLLSRMITSPILTLSDGVKALGRGELGYKVHVVTNDEFEELAAHFNKMTSDLKDYMEKLHCTTAEQERLLKELEIARGIQQSILPKLYPSIAGIDLAATNISAREVGGDFYDFVPISKDHWGLTIADVSGKGMPAAIFMGLSRTIVRASTTGNIDASSAIRHANELICRDSTSGMFVTLFYAVLNSDDLTMNYVNAGHNPPLLFKKDTGTVISLEAKGIPLGITADLTIEESRIALSEGDVLVLYTDGVTEAINARKEVFGEVRLRTVIQTHLSLSAQDLLDTVQNELIAFAGTEPQYDDITLVIMKVTG